MPGGKERKKKLLESERADRVTAPVINTFFDHLAEVKEDVPEIFEDDGIRLFNVEEVSCKHSQKEDAVLTPALNNPNQRISPSNVPESIHTTILGAIAAAAYAINPAIVRTTDARVRESDLWMIELMKGLSVYSSENGYVTAKIFLQWFEEDFIPQATALVRNLLAIPEDKPTGKIGLIMDGASPHISAELVALAVKHNIELIILPSHTSTRPLDMRIFACFKEKFAQLAKDVTGDISQVQQMWNAFTAWKGVAANKSILTAAWRETGLFPLNREKVLSWVTQRATPVGDIKSAHTAIKTMVQNWKTGNEAEDLNSLLKVLAEVAPVNQVLLDFYNKQISF